MAHYPLKKYRQVNKYFKDLPMLTQQEIDLIKNKCEVVPIQSLSMEEIIGLEHPGLKSLYTSILYNPTPIMRRKSKRIGKLVREFISRDDYASLFSWQAIREKNIALDEHSKKYTDIRADALAALIDSEINIETFCYINTIFAIFSYTGTFANNHFEFCKIGNCAIINTLFSAIPHASVMQCARFVINERSEIFYKFIGEIQSGCAFAGYYYYNFSTCELFIFHPKLAHAYQKSVNPNFSLAITPWFREANFNHQHFIQSVLFGRLISFAPPGEVMSYTFHGISGNDATDAARVIHDLFHLSICSLIPPSIRHEVLSLIHVIRKKTDYGESKVDTMMLALEDLVFSKTATFQSDAYTRMIDNFQNTPLDGKYGTLFEKIKLITLLTYVLIQKGRTPDIITTNEQDIEYTYNARENLRLTHDNIILAALFTVLDYIAPPTTAKTIKDFLLKNPDEFHFGPLFDLNGELANRRRPNCYIEILGIKIHSTSTRKLTLLQEILYKISQFSPVEIAPSIAVNRTKP